MPAMTVAQAKERNTLGVQTSGCWRCIQNSTGKGNPGPDKAKTQWPLAEVKFIGHRAFCKIHYWQEIQGDRDFDWT